MKKRMFVTLVGILAIVVMLTGCATGSKANRLGINMTKDEVRKLLGNKFVAIASKVDADGNVLDLWEYTDEAKKITYRIFFLNDKVSQWGKEEDLAEFPELFQPKRLR